MNHGYVTLDEVFTAAAARAASLVPETSGYLTLALGDAISRLPLAPDDRAVMLTTEGSVSLTRRGDMVNPRQSARALRDVLARLLAVSAGTMPGLAAAARPREESDRGVEAVVDEIEAALIPVNRAAARRALARLARETQKAKELGKLSPVRPAEAPPAPAPPAPLEAAPAPAKPAPVAKPALEMPALGMPAAAAAEPTIHEPAPPIEAKAQTPLGTSPNPALALAFAEADPSISMGEPLLIAWEDLPSVPLPREVDPTPTTLGMPPVELLDPPPLLELDAATQIDMVTVAPCSPTPSKTIPLGRVRLAPLESPAAALPTRADDLLARFGVSCGDQASVLEAAACLKKFAGIEPTPPPLALSSSRPQPTPVDEDSFKVGRGSASAVRFDSLELPPERPRRPRPIFGVGAALVLGALAGAFAVARIRPDLLASIVARLAAPSSAQEAGASVPKESEARSR